MGSEVSTFFTFFQYFCILVPSQDAPAMPPCFQLPEKICFDDPCAQMGPEIFTFFGLVLMFCLPPPPRVLLQRLRVSSFPKRCVLMILVLFCPRVVNVFGVLLVPRWCLLPWSLGSVTLLNTDPIHIYMYMCIYQFIIQNTPNMSKYN